MTRQATFQATFFGGPTAERRPEARRRDSDHLITVAGDGFELVEEINPHWPGLLAGPQRVLNLCPPGLPVPAMIVTYRVWTTPEGVKGPPEAVAALVEAGHLPELVASLQALGAGR